MKLYQDISDLITTEENAYKSPIVVEDGYQWLMPEHLRTTVLYKNSKFTTDTGEDRPFDNISRPILNLQYRTEGFDVKNITAFVNDKDNYYKSPIFKKYHDKWARENNIDTLIDDIVESYVDFGGVIVKKRKGIPEVAPLQSIAFCDQTNLLGGPIAFKHWLNPSELKEMEKSGWGSPQNGADISIDELIILSENKKVNNDDSTTDTPGKYAEIYEVYGALPLSFYTGDYNDSDTYQLQMHIVGFYVDINDQKQYVTLFKSKLKELPLKVLLRDKVHGRALGIGGGEELFEPQVWLNYDRIRIKNMLDAASITILQTDDQAFINRNGKVRDFNNLEVALMDDGKLLRKVDTYPANLNLFENNSRNWEARAQQIGAANDALMGVSPSSGTPFKLQELVTNEGRGLHEYRRGKIATFVYEIYRDWIIPEITKSLSEDTEFLSELDLEELESIADGLVIAKANEFQKEKVLNGELINPQELEAYKEKVRADFVRGGNKRFFKIYKDEFKKLPISIKIDVAGKQNDLARDVEKLTNVFRTLLSTYNPQTGETAALNDPSIRGVFNEILEKSNLKPIAFSKKREAQVIQPQIPQQIQAGLVQN